MKTPQPSIVTSRPRRHWIATLPLTRSGVAAAIRARLHVPGRNARLNRQRHLVGRARHRADHRHRRFLARPHPAGKDRREEEAPADAAIQCLCLLSLCFGGLLWPIAWLWAYTKPVLHKMAYGTDVDESLGHLTAEVAKEEGEVERLRARIAELEQQVTGGKA